MTAAASLLADIGKSLGIALHRSAKASSRESIRHPDAEGGRIQLNQDFTGFFAINGSE
ncbi:hypothetical protein FSU_2743 [Fibrobacter succinogenes subsp. succinogenes S85]|uniref:Uncharacterized protein n=1 Tax=Fibrobacter succinogenes (strain ATCC 19169 / S85) TaxID=59374 RepID=D9S6D3_FIBSS|nr:hypothetical protein [Fibrobacter succinogenes]ADL24839.1 hypothetical protein FSU_2743 [Fibrobacter succinogenes subsp. succinogenes S85]